MPQQTLEELIDRDINAGTAAADDLLLLLNAHHSTSPFANDDYDTIRNFIHSSETRVRTQFTGDPDATIAVTPPDLPPREITVGSIINQRFVLEAVIGSGGMSQVFKATDKRKIEARSRDPYVAVKVMDVRGIDADQAFIAMQREVQKSQSLMHQNIVRVNDFDRDGDIVFTTMELLSGVSLQQMIADATRPQLPLEEAIRLIHEMGEALDCAHSNNIIHADFKPSNVFVTDRNRVKVIDFGISRAVRKEDTTSIGEGDQTLFDARSLGAMTPAYASPEMIEDLEPHPRDDVYALGCVAYELITGMHPYSRLMATDARDRKHPLARPDGLSKPQWQALERTLQFDPQKRTPSVREFLNAFKAAPKKSNKGLIIGTAAVIAIGAAALTNYFVPIDGLSDELVSTPSASNTTFSDCRNCPTMLVVARGMSSIGQDRSDLPGMFEYPEHNVVIEQEFAISKHEVTVSQFKQFADANNLNWQGCQAADKPDEDSKSFSWRTPGFSQAGTHPVTCVSWQDAQRYTEWLSTQTEEQYRLPSESEWEFAARTLAEVPIDTDDEQICRQANVADATALSAFSNVQALSCRDGFAYTAPVNRYSSNIPTDMRGNVFEWTQDCWNPNYTGAPIDGSPWEAGDCSQRVLRGGSWFSPPDAQRLTYRNRYPSEYRSNTFGFRIVRSL